MADTTIYDIATKTKLSPATVSRVLNTNSRYPVSEAARKAVLDAADSLGYSRNGSPVAFAKRQREIGVVVPTISNPFYTQIISAIGMEARRHNFGVQIYDSFRDPDIEQQCLWNLRKRKVAGVIISSINPSGDALQKLLDDNIQVVAFDQRINKLRCNQVLFNAIEASKLACEHLFEMGHKKIAFFSSPLTRTSREDALDGYKLAHMRAIDRSPCEEFILISESEEESDVANYEFENGKKLATKFLALKDRPTAIVAVNDMTAIGAMQQLIQNGVRVPEDVSIVGFDNIDFSYMVTPRLTTVCQPSFDTGRLVCKMLVDSLKGDNREMSYSLQPELIIRDTVKRIADR